MNISNIIERLSDLLLLRSHDGFFGFYHFYNISILKIIKLDLKNGLIKERKDLNNYIDLNLFIDRFENKFFNEELERFFANHPGLDSLKSKDLKENKTLQNHFGMSNMMIKHLLSIIETKDNFEHKKNIPFLLKKIRSDFYSECYSSDRTMALSTKKAVFCMSNSVEYRNHASMIYYIDDKEKIMISYDKKRKKTTYTRFLNNVILKKENIKYKDFLKDFTEDQIIEILLNNIDILYSNESNQNKKELLEIVMTK